METFIYQIDRGEEMVLHPLKITSTLADETRYNIYEHMLQQKTYFTVQEIADQFSIHPNVARLHLTKLSEIGIISADYLKTGKGGRPGRVYKTTDEGVTLTFPKRQEPLLLNWTLQLIAQIGDTAIEHGQHISYEDGLTMMKSFLLSKSKGKVLTLEEKVEVLTESSTLIGYVPQIIDEGENKKILFTIYNCPFSSQITQYGEIACALHESYLKGQMDALFQTNEFVQVESMVHHCDFCKYEIDIDNSNS
ncbi:helix-turn-helix transcriptional regulator [Solibacillus sp. FSL H8-0538]|uniref:helix-turn-helix transcriptional regulator n=1 Tax=Solibacillus sp. FSL H8-0538 TaxID=2921400 RepID=UPI0030F7DA3F